MTNPRPYGVNPTNRYVSEAAEDHLFWTSTFQNGGSVTLVDYAGGDPTIERVATAGRGKAIFGNPELTQEHFLNHLATKGIMEPFNAVKLKFLIEAPIQVALHMVYNRGCSVNEMSGRYSKMLFDAHQYTGEQIKNALPQGTTDETIDEIFSIFENNRTSAMSAYEHILGQNTARELSRSVLGTDNYTKFVWKVSLPQLIEMSKQKGELPIHDAIHPYLEALMQIAKDVAPIATDALTRDFNDTDLDLVYPNDDVIVDPTLNPPEWDTYHTKRVTVPDLEKIMFLPNSYLNAGQFQVVDYMGDANSCADAARTSYDPASTKKTSGNAALLRYLVKNRHTSPTEMTYLSWEMKTPVFIHPRQGKRHRTLDAHGFMGQTPKGSKYYIPILEDIQMQDLVNRQGRAGQIDDAKKLNILSSWNDEFERQNDVVAKLRGLGSPDAINREVKGVGFYTIGTQGGDAHNIGHFLGLRLEAHAQIEMQYLAGLIAHAHETHVPIIADAQKRYGRDTLTITSSELEVLKKWISNTEFPLPHSDHLETQLLTQKEWTKPEDPKNAKSNRVLNTDGLDLVRKIKAIEEK